MFEINEKDMNKLKMVFGQRSGRSRDTLPNVNVMYKCAYAIKGGQIEYAFFTDLETCKAFVALVNGNTNELKWVVQSEVYR